MNPFSAERSRTSSRFNGTMLRAMGKDENYSKNNLIIVIIAISVPPKGTSPPA